MIWLVLAFVLIIVVGLIFAREPETNDKKMMQTLHDRQSKSSLTKTYTKVDHSNEGGTYVPLNVVGFKYRSEADKTRGRRLVVNEPMTLVAEPNNPNDPYAIKVMTTDGFHVGYLVSEDAEKLVDIMDSFVDCFVVDVYGSLDMHIKVLPYFKKESPMTLSWLIHNSFDARQIYDKKYPGFVQQSIVANALLDDYCDYIKNLYEEHKEDSYLEYLYAKILFDKHDFKAAYELFMDLINGKRMIKVREVLNFSILSNKAIPLVENGTLKSMLKKWAGDADLMVMQGDFSNASDLYLDCLYLGLHQQSLIRKICKCYKEDERWFDLHQFAEEAYEFPWLTDATSDYLSKQM